MVPGSSTRRRWTKAWAAAPSPGFFDIPGQVRDLVVYKGIKALAAGIGL